MVNHTLLHWRRKWSWQWRVLTIVCVCVILPLVFTSYKTHRVLCSLKLKPYRIYILQEVQPSNYIKHMPLCKWLQCFRHAGASCFDFIYFSDEPWFHRESYVNSQNYRLRCSENPYEFMESGLHPKKNRHLVRNFEKKKLLGPSFLKQQLTRLIIKKLLKVLSRIWMQKTDSVGFNKMAQLSILPFSLFANKIEGCAVAAVYGTRSRRLSWELKL